MCENDAGPTQLFCNDFHECRTFQRLSPWTWLLLRPVCVLLSSVCRCSRGDPRYLRIDWNSAPKCSSKGEYISVFLHRALNMKQILLWIKKKNKTESGWSTSTLNSQRSRFQCSKVNTPQCLLVAFLWSSLTSTSLRCQSTTDWIFIICLGVLLTSVRKHKTEEVITQAYYVPFIIDSASV